MNLPNSRPVDARGRAGAMGAWLALALGIVCAAAALLAGPSYRAELASLSSALLAMRWAVYGAIAGSVLALIALVVSIAKRTARGQALTVLALIVNVLVASPPLALYRQAQSLPKIHDISTDTADPPTFVAVLPLRAKARNPVDYRPDTALQQKQGYPDIVPLRLEMPPAQAFERAERAARAMGWQIVDVASGDLRIEATDTTLLFGFKDDIVIRVRAQGSGSVVDARSLSRIGGSDFGTNAKRIRGFLNKLAAA